jgi:RHH-type transcriptional regulator, proline utilization regulon repressor / proline dehydrogenase / delta 1-pyrroline-5-carboxylate dehydrogenase
MQAQSHPSPENNAGEVLKLGKEIWREMQGEVPGIFNKDFWQGRILEWAMKDPSFRVDLFRLVDVLPVLKSRKQVWLHMRDYLLRPGRPLPAVLGAALKAASGGITGVVGVEVIKRNVVNMAENFILGRDAAEAIPLLRRLHGQGIGFTADLLGEATLSDPEAEAYLGRYRELIVSLAAEVPRWPEDSVLGRNHLGPIPIANVSLKLSALEGRLDPVNSAGCVSRLKEKVLPLFLLAKEKNVFLNVDLENWQLHGIAYDLFEAVVSHSDLATWPHVGIVVQAYLKSAPADLQRLLALAKKRGAPVTVRLVKGAYWDYEVTMAKQWGLPCPVLTSKAATDAQYESLTRVLLMHHQHLAPAFGSHNLRSLVQALATADELKVPRSAYEIQMLYGMAEPERKVLRARGHRVRVYSPVGALLPGMAYLVRRLLENTSNSGFLRQSHHEGEDIAALLAPPGGNIPAAPTSAIPARFAADVTDMVPGNLSTPFRNCPRLDFALPESRDGFAGAIAEWKKHLPIRVPVVRDGKEEPAPDSRDWTSPNDAGQVIVRLDLASALQADKAVEAADKAYPAWRETDLRERAALAEKLADILFADRVRLAALQTLEVGKPWQEADLDVAEAVDFCRYYARQALSELASRNQGEAPGEANTLYFQGRGPTAIIAPWNFPLAILCGMAVAALVAGNPIVLKPAEQSSGIAYLLYLAMLKAGFPKETVQFLPGLGEVAGERLVTHPRIAQIAFTGSLQVGTHILREAAGLRPGQARLKRVVCEMGGKNAIIIDDDADLDDAVTGVLRSAFGFAGQKCSACSRVIAVGDVYQVFADRLMAACRSLAITSAENPACDMGPVIDAESRVRLEAVIADPGPGARLLYRGATPADAVPGGAGGFRTGGQFVAPAIFEVESSGHRLMQDELFGPVLALIKAEDFDQALELAAATPFALTGGVFTRSPSHIEAAYARFRVGNLYINRGSTGALVERQPFGGFGHSGLGTKAGGPGYLLHFAEPYCITENTMRHGFTPDIQT